HLALKYVLIPCSSSRGGHYDCIRRCQLVYHVMLRRKSRRRTPEPEPDYQQLVQLTREQLIEAQLRSLRSQISPHFIYNSLNAIAGLIPTDQARARELLIDFADFTPFLIGTVCNCTTFEDELTAV